MAKTENEKAIEHLDKVNRVAAEHLKGETPTEIAKTLGMNRVTVVRYLDEWKGLISNNTAIRARAHEALGNADQHYSMLISKAYGVIDEAEQQPGVGALNARTSAIKLIADMEAKRIDMLQKSGMLDNKELAEDVVRTEKKQKVLEDILKDVVSHCDKCKTKVMKRLADVADEQEAVVVDYDVR